MDAKDYPVVQIAANLLADDVKRVTGNRPTVGNARTAVPQLVIAGTLGHSPLIDQMVVAGQLQKIDEIKGRWETTCWQLVDKPFPGVDRAFVIVGSDRRGTAYGLTQLSEKIGVSPWYWWADVPVKHEDTLVVKISSAQTDAPGVKYRGIFINDEDWGLNPWAAKTFDPEFKNIGPKTYEKVFELMLRLRLNYIWPAMHKCSTEFGSVPENATLADKYAIVAGASHCEPMLYNNVHWDTKTQGSWDYSSLNRDKIHALWEDSAKSRGSDEAVWTLGIRGVHDAPMNGPKDIPARIDLVTKVIGDQRALLDQYVTKEWGTVAQCFVPYKEVQLIYDAGLKVPEDVTLVWTNDNFGYIRRLSSPEERKRSGGSGVYWHLSYYGQPHSYTWINTTPPAFMWEELHKAWENDARTIWMLNVGDIKPMEIGVNSYARLAWNPDGYDAEFQPLILHDFAAENFGEQFAQPVADLLMEFYRLGTIHKPELMDRQWALSLPPERAAQLSHDYDSLLKREDAIAASIPAEARDAYTETVGFPARMLGATGLIFMADRKVQKGTDVTVNKTEISRLRDYLEAQVKNFNMGIAGGKWNRIMPGLVTGMDITQWSSEVRWPWGEKPADATTPPPEPSTIPSANLKWRAAVAADRQSSEGNAHWAPVAGLGTTGNAMALLPATLESTCADGKGNAPCLEFDFETTGGDANAFIDFLPTFRLVPGLQLRVAVSVDDNPPQRMEIPGSNGKEDERGSVRQMAVQDNYVRLTVPLPGLAAGKHVFKIRAVDPGAVIDQVSLPSATPQS